MSTEAQIVANRRNSRKSTGPQTPEGKAVVAKNALKHGLFAQENLIIGENREDFDLFQEEILAELDPAGIMESMLAERIVSLSWRLKRAEQMQSQAIDVKIKRVTTGSPATMTGSSDENLTLGRIAIQDFAEAKVLEKLSMYERRIELSLFRTIAELQKLQLLRKAEEAEDTRVEGVSPSNRGQACPERSRRDAPPFIGDEAATQSQLDKKVKMKKQSQSPAFGRKSEILSSKSEIIGGNLKKQSQFAEAEYELSAFEKKEYELLTSNAPGQNKAKQTQCISY